MNINTLSASKLDVFLRCPREFWYRYVSGRKFPSEATPQMVQGRFTHLLLAKLATNPGIGVDQAARLAIREEFVSPEMFEESVRIVNTWYQPGKLINVLAVEEPGQLMFQGRTYNYIIDLVQRIDDIVKIKDYKTGGRFWSAADIMSSYQFMIYTLATLDRWPGQPKIRLSVDMVLLNKEVTVDVEKDEVKNFAMQLDAIAKDIDRTPDDPDGVVGPHCFTCPARSVCPFFEDYLNVLHVAPVHTEGPQPIDKAVERYVELSNLERYIGETKDQIRQVIMNDMEEKGALDSSYGSYHVKLSPRHTTVYDPSLVHATFGDEAFKLHILRVSNAEIDKAMKKLPLETQELLRKTSNRVPSGVVLTVEKENGNAGGHPRTNRNRSTAK